MASFMALAVGDSLGAHTEFMNFDYNRIIYKNNFSDFKNPKVCKYGQFTGIILKL